MIANTYLVSGIMGTQIGGLTFYGFNTEDPEGSGSNPTIYDISSPTAIAIYIVTDYAGNRALAVFDTTKGDYSIEMDCTDEINLRVGDTLDISNIYTWPENVNGDACKTTYTSHDESVAGIESIDSRTGRITANAVGTTRITIAVPMTVCTKEIVVNVFEQTYSITSSSNEGGTITESMDAVSMENAVFVITPDEHYHIADVIVDGESVGIVTEYTFENVVAEHTIEAVFAINPEDVFAVYFVDYDGTTLSTQMVERGHAATAPQEPTREHYRFTGWSCDFSNITENTVVVAQYELDITLGDVNFDGVVDCADALTALRMAMGICESDESQRAAADINGDFNVNVDDALRIMRFSLGLSQLGE